MIICANCGVELDDGMKACPLCDTPVGQRAGKSAEFRECERTSSWKTMAASVPEGKPGLQRVLWQVTSILLASGIVSTLVIDLAVHKAMTWSIYPVTLCAIVFCYASLLAFWHTKRIYQMLAGLLISATLLALLELMSQARWPLQLAFPILCAANLAAILVMMAAAKAKYRGLNVFAYVCVAIAALCIAIECILTFYNGKIYLRWSVIVAACLLPVTAALLFMHHKIRKDPDMQRIFHT